MKKPTRADFNQLRYAIILFSVDIVAYFISVLFAFFTRIVIENLTGIIELQFSFWHFIINLWWIGVVFFLMLLSNGLYIKRSPFWIESKEIVKSNIITFILVFAFVSISKSTDEVSRLTLLFILAYSTFFVITFRYIVKRNIFKNSKFYDAAIIIGDSNNCDIISEMFKFESNLGINIKGRVTVDLLVEDSSSNLKILGDIEDLNKIIKDYNITTAIIVQSAISTEKISSIIGRLHLSLSKILFIPSGEGIALSNAVTVELLMSNLSYLEIHNNIQSYINRTIKRSIDLAICILFLPLVLAITLVITVAILLTSKGNPFYTHPRIGRDGRVINVIKFRSMYIDSASRLEEILATDIEAKKEWETSYKLKNDPRVTKIGAFLRKTSLDELPQVFNVLVGDMSLVGPRPVIQEELDKYYHDYKSYYTLVRPGITGLWQVSGRSDTNYAYRVARDSWYVLNWSVWLDFTILILTPAVVLKRKGAY